MNSDTVARVLAALAQHDGRLSVASADTCGINRQTLKRAADAGVIRRTAWGRYADPALPKRHLALAGGQLHREAVLGYRGAGHFWAMDAMEELVLEWCIPYEMHNDNPLIHRRRRFDELEVVEVNGILVTSPAQTLADLGAVCDADIVERAGESVLRRGLEDEGTLRTFAVSRTRSRHGGPTLRKVLDRRVPGERPTGSDAATIAIQILRRGGFQPRREWPVFDERGLVGYGDVALPPAAFILEVDGDETHTIETRPYDYTRHGDIENAGYRVRRVTVKDVLWRPNHVLNVVQRGLIGAPLLSQIVHKIA